MLRIYIFTLLIISLGLSSLQAQQTDFCEPQFPNGLMQDFIADFVLPYTGIAVQEYVLKRNSNIFTQRNKPFFGRAYDFGILLDGQVVTRKDIYQPWEQDPAYIDSVHEVQNLTPQRSKLLFKSARNQQIDTLHATAGLGQQLQAFYRRDIGLDAGCTLQSRPRDFSAAAEAASFKVVLFFTNSAEGYVDQRLSYRIFDAECINSDGKWSCPNLSVPGTVVGGILLNQLMRPGSIEFSVVAMLDAANQHYLPIHNMQKN